MRRREHGPTVLRQFQRVFARGQYGGLLAVFIVVFWARALTAQPLASSAYLDQLVQLAHDQHLAHDEEWLRLLHYRKGLFGGWESEVDGPPFFLAADGKTEPEHELAATIRAFYAPVPKDPNRHALCQFPARFSWLDELLHFDHAPLPHVDCVGYREFLGLLRPQGLTLVFSSYFLNNPASALGHTFLRIDQAPKSQDDSRELLDYGVDYSANVDTTNALLYAIKGIFGLFPGTFHRVPFSIKVREYNDYESRDLWEYDLNLSKPQVQRVVDHIWELGSTYFAYYYMTENCSYQILGALEVADPHLRLLEGLNKPVIPADTVKALFKNPGLVKRIKYRPSNRTQFLQRMSKLTPEEGDAVALLMHNPSAALPPAWGTAEQVKVLDTALDLLDVQLARDTVKSREQMDQQGAERQQALLERRAGYDIQTDEPHYPAPEDQMPHLTHGSQRLGLGSGYDHQRGYFHALNFRVALHDLADPGLGLPDGSEIEFLPTRLRYYIQSPKLSLEELTLVRVKSLTPLGRFSHSWSWLVEAGSHRNHDRGCDQCYTGGGRFGFGFALQPWSPLTLFGLAKTELDAPLKSGYLEAFRLAVGPYGGARIRFGDAGALLVTGQWAYLPAQHPIQTWDLAGQLRVNYLRNFALGAEGHLYPQTQSLEFESYLYF
jgi:Domain of unknown function (DUF4105)